MNRCYCFFLLLQILSIKFDNNNEVVISINTNGPNRWMSEDKLIITKNTVENLPSDHHLELYLEKIPEYMSKENESVKQTN